MPSTDRQNWAGKRVLVTGAGGFVGSAVARQLIERGAKVRLIVRKDTAPGNLKGLAAEIVQGDLRERAPVDAALDGMEALFHVAADYRIWAPKPDEIVANNLAMTRTLMEAALDAKLERVVYTSSVATLRMYTDGRSTDENAPLSVDDAIGAYKRSKVVAERIVEVMVSQQGLPAVIVNPSTPIGPRDIKPTPTGRIVLEAARGKLPAFVDTGLNLVHVDDVATGHLAAYDRGRIGERYVLGGENVSLRQMLADIAALTGRRPPRIRLPRRAVYPIAYVAEAAARLTGKAPMATLDGLRMAKYHMYLSIEKAKRELAYEARPYGAALKDAIDWFRAEGMIK